MDEKKSDPIASLLNLPPMPIEEKETLPAIQEGNPETEYEKVEGDFDTARDAMLSALETSQNALQELATIAKGSQHPRAFEVLAKLVDTITSTSKDLLDIHQKRQGIITRPEPHQTINNNLVISTNELLKMLKGTSE